MAERRVQMMVTVDHYAGTTFTATVEEPTSEVGLLNNFPEDRMRMDALRQLVDHLESRVGSRAPWPREQLVVRFISEDDDGERQ